jgi:hypothetical protein
MGVLVVYESMFGNTRDVAVAIAEGLGRHADVEVAEVGAAPADPAPDLLVVGGPTHVHGMVGRRSRESARDQAEGELVSSGPLLRDWIDDLPRADGRPAAAFDTRVDKAEWMVGSAAKAITKRLRKRGYSELAERASFFVGGEDGSLEDGQLDRARDWGDMLGATLAGGGAG